MLYTGFSEIDDTLGELKNGEVTVIACDCFLEAYLLKYIIYNLAEQIDEHNRKNISNYDEKIQSASNYKNVKLEMPAEIISVLGLPLMSYNVLYKFPYSCFEQEQFDLLKKQIVLFKNLPIQQSFWFPLRRSAKLLIKDILDYSESCIKPSKISALCVSRWEKQIPLLKEVAQKLNIPVIVSIITAAKDISKRVKSESMYIDKLIIVKNDYYKENSDKSSNHKTTTFTLKNLKANQSTSIISDYYPQNFFKIYDEFHKNQLKYTNSHDILTQMARNETYINKYNFTKYINLPLDKNECFWAYIDVFQRIQIEDLYNLIAKYKKEADEKELMLAAVILRKLLIGHDEYIEAIKISAKQIK